MQNKNNLSFGFVLEVEYNVYSVCRFLFQSLLDPEIMPSAEAASSAERLLRHCLAPSLNKRATASELLVELDELQKLVGQPH